MKFLSLLLLTALAVAHAQTFPLGTAADPCTGGVVFPAAGGTFAASLPTLRFSDTDRSDPLHPKLLPFSCTFSVAPGAYVIELDFVEPSAFVPASDPNGRSFSVLVSDSWGTQTYGQMSNVDLFRMGATSAAVVIPAKFLAFTADGKIRVWLVPSKRSAVISRVSFTPYPDFSSYVPYTGATRAVDLGANSLTAAFIGADPSGAPSRISLKAGACPATAEAEFDATICLDAADNKLYSVNAAGVKTLIGQ